MSALTSTNALSKLNRGIDSSTLMHAHLSAHILIYQSSHILYFLPLC